MKFHAAEFDVCISQEHELMFTYRDIGRIRFGFGEWMHSSSPVKQVEAMTRINLSLIPSLHAQAQTWEEEGLTVRQVLRSIHTGCEMTASYLALALALDRNGLLE